MDEIQQARDYGAAREALGEARGEARGKARAIVAVLEARGIVVDSKTRARIAACTDVPTLDRWITRAAIAASAEEVIAAT